MNKCFMRLRGAVAAIGMLACGSAQAQSEPLIDAQTGQVSATHNVEMGRPTSDEVLQIYSVQSPQGTGANVGAEANIYFAPNNEPLTYSVFLNLNSSTGALFPGVMFADNMGLGGGYTPGSNDISSYDALFFRSSSDPQPGLADFHMALWNGDPFCTFDTIGGGFACAPIVGTESDYTDIPANTIFTTTALLPKGVSSPVQRVWMVVSGTTTGANPSPCRLGWDIAYGPAIIGDNSITGVPADDDIFLTQEDEDNGTNGGGICCDTTGGGVGAACDPSTLCDTDGGGTRGACWDNDAETPHVWSISTGPGTRCDMYAGSQCANFTASISAPAVSTISLVNASDESSSVSIAKAPADMELEIRFSSWDPDGIGTRLKAWEADIESAGYTTGFQGFLTPTTVACSTDDDCKVAFGGICQITGGACFTTADCPLAPIERCDGSACGFPVYGPYAGTQCEPGFMFKGRSDYVFITAGGDLPAVDVSTIDYRYASAVAAGNGVPATAFSPFPAGGVYAGTLRLTASADCKGTFTVGFKPPPSSVLVNQNNEFIPLVGFNSVFVICEIGRCIVDLAGVPACWDNVTANQCAAGPGITFFDPDPTATCDDGDWCGCLDDSNCQDGLACNGAEVCVNCQCLAGTPMNPDDGVGCTNDVCVEDGGNSAHIENVPNDAKCDDLLGCNGVETCDAALDCVTTTAPIDCDDGLGCTSDRCIDPAGTCSNVNVTTVPCPSGDPAVDCPPAATGCTDGFCDCADCPELVVEGGSCHQDGDKINMNVVKTSSPNVTSVAFNLSWDASCVSLNSITPGADWPHVLEENIGAGSLYAAYGIDPFGGGTGTGIQALVASLSFTKVGNCNQCDVCVVDGLNPFETVVSFFDQNTQGCNPLVGCSGPVIDTSGVEITCPGNQTTNADCDFPTAIVTWDAATCTSDCNGLCDISCTGVGPNGENMDALAFGGGEHPIGVTTYNCTATFPGVCVVESSKTCGWIVTVNDAQSMDVTIQLSPILTGDLQRCIKFELFSDCVQAPTVVSKDLFFGGSFDHVGHFTDDIKVPVGQFACVTARDQHHSLRACAYPECVGGVYSVEFKGDPFFGGNWLIQGNLDGWKKENPIASQDVIDILDFGAFVANYLRLMNPNTPCDPTTGGPMDGTHADINGDGIVDDLDFSFISMNFLVSSKDCCCAASTAGVINPITSISVKELRQTGNADLAAADINRDGMVDTDDITAFLQGSRPADIKPKPRVRTGSGLRR